MIIQSHHLIQLATINSSTSFLQGIEGIAPHLVMQRKAELLPNIMASRKLLPHFYLFDQSNYACLTVKAAVKQSPAPTVSTILYFWRTSGLSTVTDYPKIAISLLIRADPLLPNLSSTDNLGCLLNSLFLIYLAVASKLKSSPIQIVESILNSSV